MPSAKWPEPGRGAAAASAPWPPHDCAMGHGRAVALMVLVTLLWSMAGVVTRQLQAAQSFEVTFWRSAFNAAALAIILSVWRGSSLWSGLRRAGWPTWLSGVCWSVMFTAFMFAITMTTVARVLVTLAATPLFTALSARIALGHRIEVRTGLAIVVAAAGIVWMFGGAAMQGSARDVGGMLVALAVPVAAAVNWTVLQHVGRATSPGLRPNGRSGPAALANAPVEASEPPSPDMLPAVLIGAAISALAMLPFSMPFVATPRDLGLLALLGVVQLAVPCLLAVRVSRALPAPEIALIGLLEVVFGVVWAWLGADETPAVSTAAGGLLVIGALFVNELMALRQRP